MTTITIEFESSDHTHYFFDDVKKGIEYSKFKPEKLSMTIKENFG